MKKTYGVEQSKDSEQLLFSKHAKNRIKSRSIKISDNMIFLLKEAIKKATDKGAKNSLIIIGDTAFVVSIENYTVITIIDQNSIKERVFTNIDSAVLM